MEIEYPTCIKEIDLEELRFSFDILTAGAQKALRDLRTNNTADVESMLVSLVETCQNKYNWILKMIEAA